MRCSKCETELFSIDIVTDCDEEGKTIFRCPKCYNIEKR